MKIILQTPRLKLREFQNGDAAFIVDLLNSEGWLKYIGDRGVRTESDALNYLENGPYKSYREHGFGLYMAELSNTETPVGMCGIMKRDTLQNPDLGFAFLPQYAGHGFAFEAASALLELARNKWKMTTVDAIVLPGNSRSVGLLEKLGFTQKDRIFMPGDDEELLLFSTDNLERNFQNKS